MSEEFNNDPVELVEIGKQDIDEVIDFDPSEDTYARIAKESYASDRSENIDGFKYDPELSTSDFAVYHESEMKRSIIGVRGSSPEKPFRDFLRDTQVALGSISTLTGMNFVGQGVNDLGEVVNRLKGKKPKSKVGISGHSLGGSIASYYGVDNPDIQVRTFNKGEGIPFLNDAIKCKMSGCRNIKNSRISGDFASLGSKLGNIGEYKNLRPLRPNQETREEAKLAAGYFIEEDLYLPHSINNFIGRSPDQELNSNIYARPLASKIGKYAGSLAGLVLPSIAQKAIETDRAIPFIGRERIRRAVEERIEDIETSLTGSLMAEDLERGIMDRGERQVRQEIAQDVVKPFANTIGNLAGSNILGRSLGEFTGLAFYDTFLSD